MRCFKLCFFQKGISLMEVLVALLIFSGVLLGMVGALLQSTRDARENLYRLQALAQMNSVCERLRVQRHFLPSFEKASEPSVLSPWLEETAKTLPNGKLEVTFRSGQANIVLSWQGIKKEHRLISMVSLPVGFDDALSK